MVSSLSGLPNKASGRPVTKAAKRTGSSFVPLCLGRSCAAHDLQKCPWCPQAGLAGDKSAPSLPLMALTVPPSQKRRTGRFQNAELKGSRAAKRPSSPSSLWQQETHDRKHSRGLSSLLLKISGEGEPQTTPSPVHA